MSSYYVRHALETIPIQVSPPLEETSKTPKNIDFWCFCKTSLARLPNLATGAREGHGGRFREI
eukprot:4791378-Prymnesium_polylepis.1